MEKKLFFNKLVIKTFEIVCQVLTLRGVLTHCGSCQVNQVSSRLNKNLVFSFIAIPALLLLA